jgi:hypothetical protein
VSALADSDACPRPTAGVLGPRPVNGTCVWGVYAEPAATHGRRPHNSDRWRNSGGNIGSVTLTTLVFHHRKF